MEVNYNFVLSECNILHPGFNFINTFIHKNRHAEFIDSDFYIHYEKVAENTYITPSAIIRLASEEKILFNNCELLVV